MCDNKENIILIGFMGSGKSTVGQELVAYGGRSFVDTDELVEKKAGKPVSSIFAEEGEAFFRELERLVINDLKSIPGNSLVVATGGGVVLSKENRDSLRETGKVFWLKASIGEILKRVEGSNRPLLQKKNKEKAVKKLIDKRKDLYAATADYTIDTDNKSPRSIAEEIIKLLTGPENN